MAAFLLLTQETNFLQHLGDSSLAEELPRFREVGNCGSGRVYYRRRSPTWNPHRLAVGDALGAAVEVKMPGSFWR
jgi:hypothetical protein